MAEDSVLKVATAVQVGPLQAGMAEALSVVQSTTGEMTAAFRANTAAIETLTAKMAATTRTHAVETGAALEGLEHKFVHLAESAKFSAGGIGNVFAILPSLIGAGALGFMVAELGHGFLETATQIHRFSLQTGMSAEAIQRMHFAATQLGLSVESIDQSMIRLTRNLIAASGGSKQQAELFERLGVDAKAFRSGAMSLDEVVETMREHLSQINSEGVRTGLAMQAGGRGAKDFGILLGLTKEQTQELNAQLERTGSLMKTETIENFEHLERQVKLLWATIKGQLLPVMEVLATVLRLVGSALVIVFAGLQQAWAVLIGTLATAFISLSESVMALYKALHLDFSGAMTSLNEGLGHIKTVWATTFSTMQKKGTDAFNALKDLWGGKELITPKPGGDILGDTAKQMVADWKDTLQEMKESADAFHGITLAQELAFWTQKLGIVKGYTEAEHEVHKEIIKLRREMARKQYADELASEKDLASLARSGSAERVVEAEKARDIVASKYAEGTKERAAAERELLVALRAYEQQQVSDTVEAVREQVAETKAGSAERVAIFAHALTELSAKRHDIEAQASAAALAAATAKTEVERTEARARELLYRNEAEAISKTLGNLTREYKAAERERTDAVRKETDERLKIRLTGDLKALETMRRVGDEEFGDQRSRIDRLASMDAISYADRTAMLRENYKAQHDFNLRLIDDEKQKLEAAAAVAQTDAERNRIAAQIEAVNDRLVKENEEAGRQMKRIDEDVALHKVQVYREAFNVVTNAFERAIAGFIQGTQTFGQAMAKMFQAILAEFINMLVKMMVRWIAHWVLMHIFHLKQQASAEAASVTMLLAAETAKHTIRSTANAAAVVSESAVAAAVAYAAYAYDPPLALAMSMEALGSVLSFLPLAAFAKGGLVSADMLAMVHKNEMVLPAGLATGLQSLVTTSSRPAGVDTAGGSPAHVTINFGNISALDARGIDDVLRSRADTIAGIVRRHLRENSL